MSSLKSQIVTGAFYIGIARYSGIVFQIIISAILARLLPPSDFGVIAIATVIMTFFNLLSDIGISPAIVQRKDLVTSDYNNIFSFTIYLGFILASVFFISSWPISTFYDNQVLRPICQIMSLILFFSCARIVPFGLLLKNKRFKYQSFTTLISNSIGGVIACIAAYWGLGVYSLVLSFLIPSLLIFISYYHVYRLNFSFKFHTEPLKKIFSYSIYVFLFNLINYFSRNLDKLMIGKFISLSDLGQYQKSYNLMMMPLNSISDIITPVLHPIFSDYQNDVLYVKEKYFKLLHFISYLSFPLTVFLFFVAREAILIVYGNAWVPAIKPFQILSLTVCSQMLLSSTGAIYQAVNATRRFFAAGCINSFVMVISFCVSISIWGTIEAVAWGFVVAHFLNTVISFWMLCNKLRAGMFEFINMIARPVFFSLILFAIMYFADLSIHFDNIYMSFASKSIAFIFVMVILMQYFSEYNISTFVALLKKKSR